MFATDYEQRKKEQLSPLAGWKCFFNDDEIKMENITNNTQKRKRLMKSKQWEQTKKCMKYTESTM